VRTIKFLIINQFKKMMFFTTIYIEQIFLENYNIRPFSTKGESLFIKQALRKFKKKPD